ncbi:MAG: type I methionyl aminopeptidase [Elusimicrobia bacterium CG08_land_8_20_14_0_20_51_18]|nr:MAG: type I methionyl aminopeptidase [Elusimicrobia bacterium CG08_land_8_20_14_0_20_51_18]
MIEVKTEKEIEFIRTASSVVAKTLVIIKKEIKPGISTFYLDELARESIEARDSKPAFLGYRGYPATACVSVNEEVIHGIPSRDKIIRDGDIVSVDLGAVYKGFYGDSAITVPVGNVEKEHLRLIEVTERALIEGLGAVRNGARLGDVSNAVQAFAEKNGMSVVRDFTGHGIGRHLHEEPSIPNYGPAGTGPVLRTGMTIAVEPMICLKGNAVHFLKDGWTVVTDDGCFSAHFEHTVCVTEDGCEILSKREG